MKTLILSWSQCYGPSSDPVSAGDVDALSRAAAALQPLRGRYDVCFRINPAQSDDQKLWAALGRMASLGFGFFLDFISSDTLLIPARAKLTDGDTSWLSAWDMSHGVAHGNHDIYDAIWTAFGPLFRGGFFHEANTTGWSKLHHKDWWGMAIQFAPYDDFLQQLHAEAFVAWCEQHKDASGAPRRICWSEPVMSTMGNPQRVLQDGEQMLRNLARKYPGVLVPMFANNVSPEPRGKTYYPYLWPLMTEGTVTWGLNCQSYLFMDKRTGQPDEAALSRLTRQAFDDGAMFVSREPAWSLFNLPVGTAANGAPYSLPGSGAGLPALNTLKAALMAA